MYNTLSEKLSKTSLKRLDARELRRFRQFYLCYPQIRETVSPILATLSLASKISLPEIWESVTPKLQPIDSNSIYLISSRLLIERLSFAHFVELMQLDPVLKRQFYEVEAIRGNYIISLPSAIRSDIYHGNGASSIAQWLMSFIFC